VRGRCVGDRESARRATQPGWLVLAMVFLLAAMAAVGVTQSAVRARSAERSVA
jgi:hypothetical protein